MTSQIYPKTTFIYSLEHEARRLLYILNRLTALEFRTRGFFFLPNLPRTGQERTVIVPNIAFATIPNLWTRVKKLPATTPMTGPDDLTQKLEELLKPIFNSNEYLNAQARIEKSWSLVDSSLFSSLLKILPQYQPCLKSINIILTAYGTGCQFSLRKAQTGV